MAADRETERETPKSSRTSSSRDSSGGSRNSSNGGSSSRWTEVQPRPRPNGTHHNGPPSSRPSSRPGESLTNGSPGSGPTSEGSSASSRPLYTQETWRANSRRSRPHTNGHVPVCTDMEQLRACIADARAGTGAVAAILSHSAIQPREPAFTKLIQGCVPQQDYPKAMELWNIMRSTPGLKPNTITYSVLIHVCAATGRVKEAEDFFTLNLQAAEKGDRECQPNHITYSSLLTACTRGKKLDRALYWYDHMRQASVEPDSITYCSLIVSCLDSSTTPMERVLNIMDDMHTVGQAALPETYARILQRLGEKGQWEKATEVFLCAQMAGLGLSIELSLALLAVYERCKQPTSAKHLMQAFPVEMGPPPREIFIAALNVFLKSNAWRHAMDLWEGMMKPMKVFDPQAAQMLLEIVGSSEQPSEAATLSKDFAALHVVVQKSSEKAA